jgi:Protein of unknown function (DUF3500)
MTDTAGEQPILQHSFLKPRKYPSRSALRPSPLSELHPSVQKELQHILDVDTAAFAEPFKGVTTDGTIRPGLFSIQKTGITLQPVLDAAVAFLKALTPQQRNALSFPIDAIEWRMWHNAHPFMFRHGLCLNDMTEPQRRAALALVREGMSASGYESARNIMRLNQHVFELTGRPEEYGEYYYFMSIFGEPSADEPWGWQIDGHHMIVNCFVLGDQMILTPNFLGAEPVYAESGKYAGTRVFEAEEGQGFALMNALTPDQKEKATISKQIPRQLLTVVPWDNKILEHRGIYYDELEPAQKKLMHSLLQLYIGRMRPDHAAIRMEEVERYLNETRFGWCGECDEIRPFYYRIHSPVIVVEFDHQKGIIFEGEEVTRNHIHTVVRTPNGGDYGRDLLRQHLLQFDHSHPHTPHRMGKI